MTYEQYKEQSEKLLSELTMLEAKYAAVCPFKIGDLVEVNNNGYRQRLFLSHIGFQRTPTRTWQGYNFQFVYPTKNDRMSNFGAYPYIDDNTVITKIQ
jgi:hypothetical protein